MILTISLDIFKNHPFAFAFAFAFAPLAGRGAQVREGLRWVVPKAKVWRFTLCTLTWTSC